MGKTAFVIGLFTFYVVIITLLGMISTESHVSVGSASIALSLPKFTIPSDGGGVLVFLESIMNFFVTGIEYFINGMAFAIVGLPAWAVAVLFLPGTIGLAWVVISSFAPGGSS